MPAFKKKPKKKACYFTKNKIKFIDYKDIELLIDVFANKLSLLKM